MIDNDDVELTLHDKIGLVLGCIIMVLMLALAAAWGESMQIGGF